MRHAKAINIVLVIALCVACLGLAQWFENKRIGAHIPAPAAAELLPAPDFAFTTVTGKRVKLSDFKGKYVILNFWASWCGPCTEEMPRLLRIAKEKKKNTVLLALSIDEDAAAMKNFLNRFDTTQSNMFFGQDKNKAISEDLYQTFRVPETLLIDPQGRLLEKYIGADWKPEALTDHIGK